jgi:hypothetical protein
MNLLFFSRVFWSAAEGDSSSQAVGPVASRTVQAQVRATCPRGHTRACRARAAPLIVGSVTGSAWFRGVCVALAIAGAGCPQPADPGETASGSSGGEASTGDVTTGMTTGGPGIQTVTSVSETDATTGSSTGGGDPCPAAVEALAGMLAAGQPCEVLVHLGDGAAPQGVHVVCGVSGTTWPSGKEASAATQCCSESPTLYGADEGPIFVMHQPSDPGTDGVAIVSNHTGRVVLDARTGEGSPGTFTVPGSWQDAAALAAGMGCGVPGVSLVDALSVDLATGAELSNADRAALAAAIEGTALSAALAGAATPVRSAVVRYSPEEGGPAHDFVLLEVAGN